MSSFNFERDSPEMGHRLGGLGSCAQRGNTALGVPEVLVASDSCGLLMTDGG
jgi:hypothetical protein